MTGKNKLTAKKLKEADEKTERLVKKVEAYFRLLPESIPMYSHYEPVLYLLKNPDLIDTETTPMKKTLENFEKAFKRISSYS